MEDSLIYELLSHRLFKYREKIEKEESNFTKWVGEARAELEKSLNKEQLDLVDKYKYKVLLNEEYIEMQVEIKLLNLCIMIGMQIQKAIDEEKD